MRRERGDCLGPEWSDIVKQNLGCFITECVYISIATACNGITFTTKYNTLSTDHDKGEFIPDCCIASRKAPPAYHTYALVLDLLVTGCREGIVLSGTLRCMLTDFRDEGKADEGLECSAATKEWRGISTINDILEKLINLTTPGCEHTNLF